MKKPIYTVDSEGRIYSANNDFFAVIEIVTDIKLKGKKPPHYYSSKK